eukprot:TRINITY_DN2469_c0_g1_i2.p1 TRINITY_DN2469_c0_g1~~TRINITY_DN2469_c0_g1_i2.p1  ORF type:complete len:689 (+),score=124.76 TRINITY_DN2469_c0_g1_i2:141-2207(+)
MFAEFTSCDPSWANRLEQTSQFREYEWLYRNPIFTNLLGTTSCSQFHLALSTLFGIVVVLSSIKIFRSLTKNSTMSFQKLLFASIIVFGLVRSSRHALIFATRTGRLTLWESERDPLPSNIFNFLELFGTAMTFTVFIMLALYWERIYVIMTAKHPRYQHPSGRFKKFTILANFVLLGALIAAMVSPLPELSLPYVMSFFSAVIILLLAIRIVRYRASGAPKRIATFNWLTFVLELVCFVQVFHLAALIYLHFGVQKDRTVEFALFRMAAVRFLEFLLIGIPASLVSWKDLSTQLLPEGSNPDKRWLTNVLRHSGIIQHSSEVKAMSYKMLGGGCHYTVFKIDVQYSDPEPNAPTTIVYKVLSWKKKLHERMMLHFKKLTNYPDLEAFYLVSYEIEAGFYTALAKKVKHFKIPKIYFNLVDSFNNQFGMVMEFVGSTHTGQPDGFSLTDARTCLTQLAKFHASNWNFPLVDTSKAKMWDVAGYWTGNKREANKSTIRPSWATFMKSFGEKVTFRNSVLDLGVRMEKLLPRITRELVQLSPKTLLHGDYKVSNIFVNRNEKDPDQQVGVLDWQWMGVGSPAYDIAHFTATSVSADVLPHLEELVREYHTTLVSEGVEEYPFEKFFAQFQLCWIDYAMYAVVSKWASMTPADIATYREEGKDGLHLRSFEHIQNLVDLLEKYLVVLEQRK